MSYDKNTWATGDTITAQKLNHMEDGISGAGGVLVTGVTMQSEVPVLTNTWQEIFDAPLTVLPFVTESSASPALASEVTKISDNEYQVAFKSLVDDSATVFVTDSADGYPSYQGD